MKYQLKISNVHYEQLRSHLYPGDNLEAVAIALCGRFKVEEIQKMLVHEVILIPHNECERTADFVSWKTDRIRPILEKAQRHDYAILKMHSHPRGYEQFSSLDDDSDHLLFSSVFGWIESDSPHASSVMLPDGRIFGRIFTPNLSSYNFDRVVIVGDEIKIFNYSILRSAEIEVGKRTAQAFGDGTFNLLKNLKIGVIGCSGTGSPVIEQLVRLGIGTIILVDPDKVELTNLNRILNTKRVDALKKRFKVEVLRESIESFDLGAEVKCFASNLFDDLQCLRTLAECDIIFGCVDSVDGRDLMNRLSTYYLVPYFDLGVKLEANGQGGIEKIVGTVHYIQPGKSSLMSRGLYDSEDLKAAGLYRMYPEQFQEMVKNSYLKNVNINTPAVISVNMMIAGHAVNEFLNRIHVYKCDPASDYAQSTIDITESCFVHVAENRLREDTFLKSKIGLGDRKLFLDMIELSNLEL